MKSKPRASSALTKSGKNTRQVVMILAPKGKGARLSASQLEQAGFQALVCRHLDEVSEELTEKTGALLLAREALGPPETERFLKVLTAQPVWSDLPVIIVTSAATGDAARRYAINLFGPNANVTVLERPVCKATLISSVQVALRERRRQYEMRDLIEQRETVLASISDAFSALDRKWRYTYVNDKVGELAGLPREKLLGRVIWEIFPEAVGGEFYNRCHRAMETQQMDQFEVFYKPWQRWLETRVYPRKGGIVVFSADITERKRHEALALEHGTKLEESEDRLRLATEAADIGTFDFYPPTGELKWSDRCKELFGLPPEATVTYDAYLSAVHPDDRHIVRETVRRVLQPGSRGRYQIEYRTIGIGDGKERWVTENGRVFLDSSGKPARFIGTVLDITERKHAEIILQRAKQEAEEANRAKDEFLAMLSHELRTPLTPVLMTVAALRREHNINDEMRRDLEMVQRNIELESLLIDDLLDLTRIAHGKLELRSDAVDIHTSIEHALSISAAELIARQLTVTRRFEAQEHHSWADAARLQQVFWNLIKNAAKFTPEGGRIAIHTRNDDKHHVIIEVTDNGIGIDPEVQPRIFDAFEQGGRAVTSKYGGLGLGLAISKRVVDMHDGTITVQSAGRDQGSTFTVVLNAMETSLLEGPAYFLDAGPDEPSGVKLMLVEDHEDTARVMQRILENAGYVVAVADSLSSAHALASQRRFDLVISDLGLPDGSGLELMRYLHETQGLPGIALSGFGTDDDVAASKAAGFAEHLVKPIDWERLRNAIVRLTRAKANLPEAAVAGERR